MLFKPTNFLIKNLTAYGRVLMPVNQPLTPSFSGQNSILARSFLTNESQMFSNSSSSGEEKQPLPTPPKRSPNVFALFVKEHFKELPADMPNKEKFAKAAEHWREMSHESKEDYKKIMTDGLIKYRQEMSAYMESLSPEAIAEFKKLKKEKIKDKTRQRIKSKLRKLNYPKKPCSSYIFFIRDQLQREYPEGNYPAVRTPDHIRWIGIWSQRWRNMSMEEKALYTEQSERDRQRYFEELEKWKQELGKPENEEDLLMLERLSRKIENTNKSEEEVKKKQKKVATKVIRARVAKKTGASASKEKKKSTGTTKKTTVEEE